MPLELKPGEAANLLSLDGGGIKGISTLTILQAIMDKVQELETGIKPTFPSPRIPLATDRKPIDYFHLAGGTSTGGIVALMLFRLRMSPQEAIDAYKNMASKIFGTKVKGKAYSFEAQPLLDAIDGIVNEYGTEQDKKNKGQAPLVDDKGGRMFMCATMQERGESILLRSYTPPADAIPVSQEGRALLHMDFPKNLTIAQGTRATSAAPTYFPELLVKTAPEEPDVTFWDGGLLNNNPIDQLWRARLDLVDVKAPPPKVACVLSIGTSWSSGDPPSMVDSFLPQKTDKTGMMATAWNTMVGGLAMFANKIADWMPILDPLQKMIPFLTNTEAKHLDFSRYINRLKNRQADPDATTTYFRFNTPLGNNYLDMADYKKMTWLAGKTKEWLASQDAKTYVDQCAAILAKKKVSK